MTQYNLITNKRGSRGPHENRRSEDSLRTALDGRPIKSRCVRHSPLLIRKSRSGKLWITRPYSGILTLRQDSEWRDRAGFNGRPDLIPAVPY